MDIAEAVEMILSKQKDHVVLRCTDEEQAGKAKWQFYNATRKLSKEERKSITLKVVKYKEEFYLLLKPKGGIWKQDPATGMFSLE